MPHLRTCLVVALLALPLGACAAPRTAQRDPYAVPGGARLDADVRAARVVYAGELHDDRAQHAFQLELLRTMADQARRDGAPLLLGMEMFQRPFQRHLDDYVAGRIDELEMLRRTEYFERWRYDHTFYAPLWRFCREHGIRVVALNAEAGIVRQVGREGLASLDAAQRASIASVIDLDVAAHRERILGVFQGGAHQMPEARLNAMYEAMTTWDETMAESAADALAEAGPRSRMLIVAGSQHVQERTGIPDRVARRMPGIASTLVVMRTVGRDGADDPDSVGDHVVRLPAAPEVPPSRLGVQLATVPEPDGLLVQSVVEGGNAARAGLLAGDVLAAIDGAPVTDMTDLRYALDATPPHGVRNVTVLRDGQRLALRVVFEPPAPPPEAPVIQG